VANFRYTNRVNDLITIEMTTIAIVMVLLITAITYGRGWLRLQVVPERQDSRAASRRSLVLALLGFGVLALGLLPPLSVLSTQFFLFRMVRHLLLSTVAPCFIFLADPLPALWCGLSSEGRTRLRMWGKRRHRTWTRFKMVFNRGTALFLSVAATLIWFDGSLHHLTLRVALVHSLESLVLIVCGGLYWWHISGASPRLSDPLPTFPHAIYAAVGALPIKVSGIVFLSLGAPLYSYPNPDLGWITLSPLQSFHWGGALVWMLGGITYSYAALWLLQGWLGEEEQKPPIPRSMWDTPEAMLAPGFDQ